MPVGGERVLQPESVYHDTRDAVRKGPVFVRPLGVETEARFEKLLCGRENRDVMVRFETLEQREKTPPLSRIPHGIRDLDHDETRCYDAWMKVVRQRDSAFVGGIISIEEGDVVKGIGEDAIYRFGRPCA